MLSSLFIILAAVLNSLMDIFENENFHKSIFNDLNQKFWYKRESWKYAKKLFGYKFDAWHICKSLMIICFCLALVFYKPIFGYIDILFYGALWNLTFNIFYNKILK